MTRRAVLFGLLGAAFFCGFGYFHDHVIRETLCIGSNMPNAVYGALILFLLVVNPLLRRFAFSGREVAVILVLTLAACVIPSSSFMRIFTPSLIMPHRMAKTNPGWKEQGILETVPARMLVDVSKDEDTVLTGFRNGLGGKPEDTLVGGQPLSAWGARWHLPSWAVAITGAVVRIPWGAWVGTLGFWLLLVLALWIGLIGLSLVTHRQWADHEHLPYPIATFAETLLPESGTVLAGVFRSGLFWLGTVGVLCIRLNNYAFQFFPRRLVEVPTHFDLRAIVQAISPTLVRGGGGGLTDVWIYFAVIGIAYFIAMDVSFAMGIGPILYSLTAGVFLRYGVAFLAEGPMSPDIQSVLNFGAYFGAFLVLLYSGRNYYGRVFRSALLLPTRDPPGGAPIWGARVFLLSAVALVVLLTCVGLDWQLAVLYTGLIFILYVVIGRIIAETGLFLILPEWYPCIVLWALFGTRVIGVRVLMIMMLVSVVLALDPRAALMPFMVNSLKLLRLRKIEVGKPAIFSVVAVVVGLAVAIPVILAFQYDLGMDKVDRWSAEGPTRMWFTQMVINKQRLQGQGSLEHTEALSGWKRFSEMAPARRHLLSFGSGAMLFILFTAARLRFPRWPLHPVMFLIWSTWPGPKFAVCFLLGWFIKRTVIKYGGIQAYHKLKPLMLGLIAGEMLGISGGIIPMIIGIFRYLLAGPGVA